MKQEIIQKLIRERKIPFYLFDAESFRSRIRQIRSRLPQETKLAYAIKANPFLAEIAAGETDRLEICSYGEYRICRKRGIQPEKMLISGVLKKEAECRQILEECGGKAIYTAESRRQFEILNQWSAEKKEDICVYLRLTSQNQFGMDLPEIRRLITGEHSPYLHIEGLHYFSGTQKRSFEKVFEELKMVRETAESINREDGGRIKTLEFGPGFRVDYFEKKGVFPDPMSVSEEEWQKLRELLQDIGKDFLVRLEMGRFMAASCGCYVTMISDTKENNGTRYAIVDGGIHQINYDGQIKGMYKPRILHFRENGDRAEEKEKQSWIVCGSLCTVNDILVKDLQLDGAGTGDRLVFLDAGAYAVSEGMALFLSHELPEVFLYDEESGRLRQLRKQVETWQLNTEGGSNG